MKGYIKVPERSRNGKQHLHVLFRGSYIEQQLLSRKWEQLHHAKIIDIRAVGKKQDPKGLARDMASYMVKENHLRYSWNWGWVWRGFCNDWKRLKRLFNHLNEAGAGNSFSDLLRWWRLWLRGFWKPDFDLLPAPS